MYMTEIIAIAAVVGVVVLLAVVFVLRGRGQQPQKPQQRPDPQERGGKPSAPVATRPMAAPTMPPASRSAPLVRPAQPTVTARDPAQADKPVQRQATEPAPATARLPVARPSARPVATPAPTPALRQPAPAPQPPLAAGVKAPLIAPALVQPPVVSAPVVVPVIARFATPPPAPPTPPAPLLPPVAGLRQVAPTQAPRFDAPDTLPPPDAIPAVLLVDDSAVVRAKLKKLLDSAGYQVAIARDGLDALEVMRGRHFDLLITDLEMPNMDGPALIAAVQSKAETWAMPILAITGHEQLPAGLPVGSSSLRLVLRKPWVDADVLSQVAAALSLAPALRQAAMV